MVGVEANLRITEFMSGNRSGLMDVDQEVEDWIELHNPTSETINLQGWSLTDDATDLNKWSFPDIILKSGKYLVIYASGKDRRSPESQLHTNFRLSTSGEYLALVQPDGVTIEQEHSPTYPVQYQDISYGVLPEGVEGYFREPSPGSKNGDVVLGFLKKAEVSPGRGFYDEPFELKITSDIEGVVIRYTTNGNEPTAGYGKVYTKPLSIKKTSYLRVGVFKEGYQSPRVEAHTMIFVKDVKNQSFMNKKVTRHEVYEGLMEKSLLAVPTLSLVLPSKSFFRGEKAIYEHANKRGREWERAVSMEYMDPKSGEKFQIDGGIRIHGHIARIFPKKPLRLYFRDEYGAEKLEYPILHKADISSFDKLILRPCTHDSWQMAHEKASVSENYGASYIRDEFARRMYKDMGRLSPMGRFVHVYVDGRYWGLYNLHERADAFFMSDHLGGRTEDWDFVCGPENGPGIQLVDGTLEAWNRMMKLADSGMKTAEKYEALQEYINIDEFVDYMFAAIWLDHGDWLSIEPSEWVNRNWISGRNRDGGGFQFFIWDLETSMGKHGSLKDLILAKNLHDGNIYANRTRVTGDNSPGRVYHRLRHDNAEFRLRFGDRVQKHLFNDGAMTPKKNKARWLELTHEVRDALVAESARWGGYHKRPDENKIPIDEPYTRDEFWELEVNWVEKVWMEKRNQVVIRQLQEIGLYPMINPPQFSHAGGEVSAGTQLALRGDGEVYFTLNGSDPRDANSPQRQIGKTALLYQNPIRLSAGVVQIAARVLNDEEWSALNVLTYKVGLEANLAGNLRVSEIMYHPADEGELDGDRYEFLELENTSNLPLDLSGASFSNGIRYEFDEGSSLGEGKHLVLVRNLEAFKEKYPNVEVGGEYGRSLSNGGERLAIEDKAGRNILEFEYDDGGDWPKEADGGGHSLVWIGEAGAEAGEAANWSKSAGIGGSPGSKEAEERNDLMISDYGYENGEFWIQFQGEAGRKYGAESSIDLVNWKAVGDKVTGQDNLQNKMSFDFEEIYFIRIKFIE